jgi:hypothetical protein
LRILQTWPWPDGGLQVTFSVSHLLMPGDNTTGKVPLPIVIFQKGSGELVPTSLIHYPQETGMTGLLFVPAAESSWAYKRVLIAYGF